MHNTINPKILYFGTPVVLISTLNEDSSPNLAPMSSAWWINQSGMLGMSKKSKTVENLERERECVLNLPCEGLVGAVDKLALLTGKNPVPVAKANMGYRYEKDKFGICDFTPTKSQIVKAPLVKECPIQMEAIVKEIHAFDSPHPIAAIEVKILKVHIEESLLMEGTKDHVDPEKWRPLIMNFCEFFGLSQKLYPSRLAEPFLSRY
ncbi:flavin reductase family protein [Pseudalkalibacillus salsuginis]|uniref:flavin reductase family protein n=1 Tax=Pseudalkalibacillus salsuginis TaxID=2910972 RepID=UPI001F1C6BF0|nr:flavin reductase family protein [Pseudalkalibacillus salsuginis]MCF6411059.1 flavin reductase family protein [Pseudalkalibacillus salsuginis]